MLKNFIFLFFIFSILIVSACKEDSQIEPINLNESNSCESESCNKLGVECGSTESTCGNIIECGICPLGKTCSNNKCIQEQTQSQDPMDLIEQAIRNSLSSNHN